MPLRAIIFANGAIAQPIEIPPSDLVIAADGGARHCRALGIHPDILIGDFDSLEADEVAQYEAEGTEAIRHPKRKDHTDLELAVHYAHQAGASEILVLGALGARWDQTVANVLLPAAFPPLRMSLLDGNQELHYLHSGDKLEINGQVGDTVSLIPLSSRVEGITTQNLEYPLEAGVLVFGSTRGVSNVLLKRQASVALSKGNLLCIVIHHT